MTHHNPYLRGNSRRLVAPLAVTLTAGFTALAPHAAAQTREPALFALLDASLRERTIDLVSIRDDSLAYRDDAGRLHTVRLADTAALLPAWWSPRTRPADSYGASVVPIKKAPLSLSTIELVDGQRIGVRLSPDAPTDPDTVWWETPTFGRLAITLDAVRYIKVNPPAAALSADPASRPASPPVPAATKDDTIFLVNGDRLSGLVEQIGPVIAIESGGKSIQTPAKQVAGVYLVNPPRAPRGSRVWLTDGTVVDVERFLVDPGSSSSPSQSAPIMLRVELRSDVWTRAARPTTTTPGVLGVPSISPGASNDSAGKENSPARTVPPKNRPPLKTPSSGEAPSGAIKLAQLAALVPSVQTLVSLASRPLLRQQPIADRPPIPESEPVRLWWAGAALDGQPASSSASAPASRGSVDMPPLDAADIELPGPMIAEWSVPPGARRLAGWVELPRDCWTWGECGVVFSLAHGADASPPPVELFRASLAADTPTAEFNIELPGDARVPGASAPGPVLRVTLNPGERGPIQDRLLIRRALFLCAGPATK